MAKKFKMNNRVKFDGWNSFLSSFSDSKANKSNVKFEDNTEWFDDETLDAMWLHDGFTHRVISCISEDIVNKGFTITGDSANIDMNEVDRLNTTGVIFEAICKAQLHGGSAILMGINDGGSLQSEVKLNSIQSIDFLRVIPKAAIRPDSRIDTNPSSADYGKPDYYYIHDSIQKDEYKVHKSRLWLFPWLEYSPIKPHQKFYNSPSARLWGDSVMEHIYKQVGNVAIFGDALSHLAQEAVIGKYKLGGLNQMFAMGDEGEKKVMTRLDIINMAKSVINGVILDADSGEDYTRDSLQFSGMNGVADTLMVFLSGVSGIPVTRLFGRSPAGLDSSGDSDMKIYYDMVAAYQKTMLTSFLKRLVFYIDKYKKALMIEEPNSAVESTRNGKVTGNPKRVRPITETDIDIKWNPLYQMTEKERAETYSTNANADISYLNAGILSKEEVRVSRFLGGYNAYVTVESADIPETDETVEQKSEENVEKTKESDNNKGKSIGK